MRRTIAALCLAAIATAACGESYSYTDGQGNRVTLHTEDCKQATGWLKMKRASIRWQGKDYDACWFAIRDAVVLIDESGDAGMVPTRAFRQDTGA